MTAPAIPDGSGSVDRTSVWIVAIATAVTFAVLFAEPLLGTVRLWWNDPESGHGLLLAPLAICLAWRAGVADDAHAQRVVGMFLLVLAVVARYVSALAAEAFIARFSLFLAAAALVLWMWGFRQLMRWWLPATLLALSLPLPEIVLGTLALPLQFKASQLGAALLSTRGIPVHLDGNVIRLPGHDLFVTEACSGLRSLTALLSLGVLLGGMLLKRPALRVLILLFSIPVAVLVNGVRVFMTGFLVAFVDPSLGDGFSHTTEGWLLFIVAFAILGLITWIMMRIEFRLDRQASGVTHA
ncbi:MAG: exosortase/archaeosortase family protein [Gemmatimonadaceae bacterium]